MLAQFQLEVFCFSFGQLTGAGRQAEYSGNSSEQDKRFRNLWKSVQGIGIVSVEGIRIERHNRDA